MSHPLRLLQAFTVFAAGLYGLFVFMGNLMDYNSNYQFVEHVLSMDTTFEGNALMWRAITEPWVWTVGDIGIIIAEGAFAALGLIGGILLLELFMVVTVWRFAPEAAALRLNPSPAGVTNAEALGRILYTDYIYLFQASGIILLVAMIGAIVLTLRDRPGTKRQDIGAQVARSGSVSVRQVPVGAGLKEIGIARPPSPEEEAPKQVEHHGHGGHH